MSRILALDNLCESGLEVFQKEGFDVDVKPPQKPEELAAIIGEYDGLVIRSATKVTAEALAHSGKLKVIGRAGVGTDNVDKVEATKRGIVVMNVPGGNTISTCEHTLALLLALCRNIPKAHQSMREGRWDRKLFMGTEVRDKTLGIIGVGRIGGEVAKRAQAFEMKVLAFDPILTRLKAEALGVELVSLDEMLERADFISIHAPKSDKTLNMIGYEQLKQMKPTCRIINCARGGIVNEADLARALKEGVIAGAALDVYTSEPFEDNPFAELDNVIMTPHLAASTGEAQLTVAVDVAKQMVEYLKSGTITNAVNVPSLDGETRKKLSPLLYLAERLGTFLSGYMKGTPKAIRIDYSGALPVTDTYPLTVAVLIGFLKPLVESVNEVSAPSLLEDHGIDFSETRRAHVSDYNFLVGVTVETDQEKHLVAGTLFGDDDPRICVIDGTRVNAVPEGHMVVCRNEDKPLIIGRIATIIGDAGVNIANLVLGRDERGGRAATILNIDDPLSDNVMEEIRAVPFVKEARQLKL
ncbi:MAG: phosphoglycerate dehydrogenase [Candidatus Hydrogenedentales bacterium]|jgi:D-3-phosphoglycerate dehydrogenase